MKTILTDMKSITPLRHKIGGHERITIGLGWDERQDKIGFINRLIKKDSQHDLDIVCYVYDDKGGLLDFVGAEAQDSVGQSGKIYHSGDDMTGAGDGDDEFIHAELANIPKNYHALIFMVEIRSQHDFQDISAPFCRIADSASNENLLYQDIDIERGRNQFAYVMASIYRSTQSETGWALNFIDDFPNTANINDWGAYLSQYSIAKPDQD